MEYTTQMDAARPYGVGSALKTKVNVNLGVSRDCMNLDVELEKAMSAVSMGAEVNYGSLFSWRYPNFSPQAYH